MNTLPSPAPGPRTVRVGEAHAGQRLDNFLLTLLKGVPRSHVYRILRTGEVRVNRGRAKAAQRLEIGDEVRLPPVRTAAPGERPAPSRRRAEDLAARILYEDRDLLVLNKPSGLAVHGGSGISLGAIEALRAMRPEAEFLELVHRLDRDTSGCLMVAKRRPALRALHEALRAGTVEKRYQALLAGRWKGGKRTVNVALRKNVLAGGERVVRVDEDDGRAAATTFTPLRRFADATLVEARLHTGRTHQIRVHAAHAGHPIAGDEKYGDAAFNRALRTRGLKRLFLHAASLRLAAPGDGGPIQVEAPLEPELAAVIERMEAVGEA